METIIIAGFPGTGKSILTNEYRNLTSDSDSSKFSWIMTEEGKVRNPDFPNNYIEHIKSLIGKVRIIFVSTHDVVRQALKDNNIEYVLVYPGKNCKDIYMNNYKNRGNDDAFLKLMDQNWDKFINQLEHEEGCSIKLVLMRNKYIKDIPFIKKILEVEEEKLHNDNEERKGN